MSVVEWNKVSSTGKRSQFLRLEPGTEVTVRFIGKPKLIYKYFHRLGNQARSAICADPEKCTVKRKYNMEPDVKFGILLIDRSDGQVKVAEVPRSVLAPVGAWAKRNKDVDPGGNGGCDWTIQVGKGKPRQYHAFPDSPKPFTEEELTMLKTLKAEKRLPDLDKIFAPVPDSEIEAKLFGQEGSSGGAETETEVSTPVGVAASDDDLPF